MSRLQISSTPTPVSAYEHLQRDLRRMSPYMKKELAFYDYDEKKLYFETMDDYN